MTGTSYAAATDALQGLRVNGRLVLATIDPTESFVIAPTSPVWARRQQIIGSTHNGLHELVEALDVEPTTFARQMNELDCHPTRNRVPDEDGTVRRVRGYLTAELRAAVDEISSRVDNQADRP